MLFLSPKEMAVLKAAFELFASGRYQQTTVADIARRAGVTLDTFYRHFGSKQQLARTIYLDILRERDSYFEVIPPADASLQRQFLLLWCRMADFAVEHPESMDYLENYRDQLESHLELDGPAVPSALLEVIELLTRAGIAKEKPALMLSAIVWGAFLQLFRLHRRGDCPFSDDLVRSAAQCCLDAISGPCP